MGPPIDPADHKLRVVPDVGHELGERIVAGPPGADGHGQHDDPAQEDRELRHHERSSQPGGQRERRRRLQKVLRQVAAAVDRDRQTRR